MWAQVSETLFWFLLRFLINMGLNLGFFEWEEKPPVVKNGVRFLFEAAEKRGIKTAILRIRNRQSRMCLAKRKKSIVFETLPSSILYTSDPEKIDNKYYLKRKLHRFGIPTPEGRSFRKYAKARFYARAIGYPVVVKPVVGSLSEGVTTDIKNDIQLKRAVEEAKKYWKSFLVEEQIFSRNYRVTVIGEKIFVCLRERPSIKGDGFSTIAELIEKRNNHVLRGPIGEVGWTLRQINLKAVQKFIKNYGFSLNDKLPKGKKIFLGYKINLSSSADIFDKTRVIHHANAHFFINLSRLLGAPIVGFDVMMDNIGRHYKKQTFSIIEANTIPAIDMHHVPLRGKKQDVAGAIWDLLLKKEKI